MAPLIIVVNPANVGRRLHCVAAPDGTDGVLITSDIDAARAAAARADFFDQSDQEQLHRAGAARFREE